MFFKYKKENNDLKSILFKLNADFCYNYYNFFPKVQSNIIELIKKEIINNPNKEYIDYKTKLLEDIEQVTELDGILITLKKHSYDLWSAIDLIFNFTYVDNLIEIIENTNTIGPILNKEIQKQNFKTGLQCALLFNDNVIINKESFYGFDT